MAARIFTAIVLLAYTIFFMYSCSVSETGDVSLFFAYFNFPVSLILLKPYEIILSIFNIIDGNVIIYNILTYLAGAIQYGAIGYFLGWIFDEIL